MADANSGNVDRRYPYTYHTMRLTSRLAASFALMLGSVATLGAQSTSTPVHTRAGDVSGIAGQRPAIRA
jgi:hypothetical protein